MTRRAQFVCGSGFFAALAASAAIAGSSCGSDPAPPGPTPPTTELTFYRDIEPIVQVSCDGCHAPGGIGPVVLDAETAPALAGLIAEKVKSGVMPPWQPSELGPPLVGDRRLSQGEIDAIVAWAAGGAPLGDPADHKEREPMKTFELTDPDVSVKLPAPYAANKELEDDVRCFVIDLPFQENTWVRAVRFNMDQRSSVHHIGAAVVAADQAAVARGIDDTEKDSDGVNRPGYACPGGVRAQAVAGFGAGGPGSEGVEYADGIGVFVPGGSSVIISMHYYTPQATAPDQSGLDLWISDKPLRAFVPVGAFAPTELPCPGGPSNDPASPCSREKAIAEVDGFAEETVRALNDYRLKFCNTTLEAMYSSLDFSDPAAAQFLVTTECEHEVPYDGAVYMASAHMHTRGHSARLEVERSAGAWEPLLDIPRWDWHWESTYGFVSGEPLKKGEKVRIRCTFDNGAAAQPPLPGESMAGFKLDPRYVLTGEGRLDEMCGGDLWLSRAPRSGSYESLCAESKALFDEHCPGYEAVSQSVFMNGPCDAERERYAIQLQYTPDKDIKRIWCDPPPSGAGATVGATCEQAVLCAGQCAFGACAAGCRDQASPVGEHYYDRLLACSDPYCADQKGDLKLWGACAAIACKFEAGKCFAP